MSCKITKKMYYLRQAVAFFLSACLPVPVRLGGRRGCDGCQQKKCRGPSHDAPLKPNLKTIIILMTTMSSRTINVIIHCKVTINLFHVQ